jgi:hypothetical protein
MKMIYLLNLDNNKQVEYRVKSPKFYITYVFQYYYLNIKILNFLEILNYFEIFEVLKFVVQ